MGFFDQLKRQAESAIKREATKAINNAVKDATAAIGKGRNRNERFTFSALPMNLEQLKAMPEASLDSAFKTTALTMAALCRFEASPEDAFAMLAFLKGPAEFNNKEKQLITEKLKGKAYKARSFFNGATPENSYAPSAPYTIIVSENPYSFDEENWATLYVTSSGADNARPIKLRKKPSTGQWFLNDIQCLSDIKIPVAEDPWA